MSIEDEIREAQKAKITQEKNQEKEDLTRAIMTSNGFLYCGPPPIVQTPSQKLNLIVAEVLPYLVFKEPKFLMEMPDGNTYIRSTIYGETPNSFTFDVKLDTFESITHSYDDGYYINLLNLWILPDGRISFCRRSGYENSIGPKYSFFSNQLVHLFCIDDVSFSPDSYEFEVRDGRYISRPYAISSIRQKIINELANPTVKPKPVPPNPIESSNYKHRTNKNKR